MASEMFNSLELKCETSWVLVPSFLATMNKTSLKRNYMVKKRITQVISVQRSFKKKEIVSCNEKARTKFTGLMIYPRLQTLFKSQLHHSQLISLVHLCLQGSKTFQPDSTQLKKTRLLEKWLNPKLGQEKYKMN